MSIKKLQALRAKKGFTLVELIVVIAIIAILAAILIPMLVNHIRSSACTREIADAKSIAGVVAGEIADQMTRGASFADAVDAGKVAGEKIDTRAVVVRPADADDTDSEDNIVVQVDLGEHGFISAGADGDSEVACGWGRCPANRNLGD